MVTPSAACPFIDFAIDLHNVVSSLGQESMDMALTRKLPTILEGDHRRPSVKMVDGKQGWRGLSILSTRQEDNHTPVQRLIPLSSTLKTKTARSEEHTSE